MTITLIGFFVVMSGIIYSSLIFWYYYGWIKTPVFKPGSFTFSPKVSVIVAFRNEEKVLQNLLNDLINQSYSSELFEVILVDDHSTDGSYDLVKNLIEVNTSFKLIKNQGEGKKQAISEAIEICSGELFITTDADCRMGNDWLKTITSYYSENSPDMLIGPVLPARNESVFSKLVALEFFSLIGSAAGAAGIKHPIMNNGANLAYPRTSFNSVSQPFNSKTASGEDIFFMLKLKKNEQSKIRFLKSNKAAVSTHLPTGFEEFWQQRVRWVSKSKYYTDFDMIFSAVIVWLVGFLMLSTLIAGIFYPIFFIMYAFLFVIKSVPDYLLLSNVLSFFDRKDLIRYFIPLQVIYPLYVTLAGFFGLIFAKFSWKDRKY